MKSSTKLQIRYAIYLRTSLSSVDSSALQELQSFTAKLPGREF